MAIVAHALGEPGLKPHSKGRVDYAFTIASDCGMNQRAQVLSLMPAIQMSNRLETEDVLCN